MAQVQLDDVVLDEALYPRARRDEATVSRYAGAMAEGADFPPIVLETGTGRLLDGWHRVDAARACGRDSFAADQHTVPEGMDARLYAASLSAKHGLPVADADLQEIARELYRADESLNVTEVARQLGRARRTVQGWVQEIADEREVERERLRMARRLAVALLAAGGWNQSEIAEALGVHRNTVHNDGELATDVQLDEGLLRSALDLIPRDIRAAAESVAEQWREERIFATWSDEERSLLKQLRDGETVVLTLRGPHDNLGKWAEDAGLYVRIDRKGPWGNPFELPGDGDRETVIRNYEEHYLPYKPSLLSRLPELRGKALGCWCAPEACHGDVLKARAEG